MISYKSKQDKRFGKIYSETRNVDLIASKPGGRKWLKDNHICIVCGNEDESMGVRASTWVIKYKDQCINCAGQSLSCRSINNSTRYRKKHHRSNGTYESNLCYKRGLYTAENLGVHGIFSNGYRVRNSTFNQLAIGRYIGNKLKDHGYITNIEYDNNITSYVAGGNVTRSKLIVYLSNESKFKITTYNIDDTKEYHFIDYAH